MKMLPTRKKQFRRRKESKTDYKQRLELLKSGKPRLVVRRSINYITAQIIKYDKKGDITLVSASSKELKKAGWKYATDNIPAAYLTGLIIAKRAKEKKISDAVLDIGLQMSIKGARIYAVAKGAKDGGLVVPINEEIAPSEDRITGKHIASYLQKFKDLPADFEKQKQKLIG